MKIRGDKLQAVIFDLDGTLSDHSHRVHLLQKKKKEFVKYFEGAVNDPPIPWCVDLVRAMNKQDYQIIFLSSRPKKYLKQTISWLFEQCGLLPEDYVLFLAPSLRNTAVWKRRTYLEKIKPRYDVLFVVEDWDLIVKMWRKIGVTCLHCDGPKF